MSRRKTILYGRTLDGRLDACLGFPEYERTDEVLAEIYFGEPKIDWSRIESLCDHEVSAYSRDEIDFAFEVEIGFRVRNAVTRQLSGPLSEDETSEAEFLKKADKIASLAQKLTQEIDELAEIGSALILRPLRKDGLTSAEKPDEFYAQVTGKTERPTHECFADYISFRKVLDYYSAFSAMNGDFRSVLGDRFDRMPDYSWYETFVRRVVLALWPTDFPMTVTMGYKKVLTYTGSSWRAGRSERRIPNRVTKRPQTDSKNLKPQHGTPKVAGCPGLGGRMLSE